MQNWEEIQERLKSGQLKSDIGSRNFSITGGGKPPNAGPEITSAEAGINTLEDLMNIGGAFYSRSDPTLWNIGGQQIRIDPDLYRQLNEYHRAYRESDVYKSSLSSPTHQPTTSMTKEEWTKQYLANLGDKPEQLTKPQASITPTQPITGQPTPLPPSQWQTPITGQPITEQPVTGMIQPNFQYQPTKPPMPTGQPTGVMQRPSTGFDIGSFAHRLWDKTLGRTSLPDSTFAQNRFSGMTTGWDNPYYKNLFRKSRWGTQRR